MAEITRRHLLEMLALALAPAARNLFAADWKPQWDWAKSCRCVIAEAYNPPFYPSLDYRAGRAIEVCQALHADSLRYPAASYFAYFPTATEYPRHPELGDTDPMRDTVERAHRAGLKVIAYVPLNHPFMDASDPNPLYQQWTKRFADGKPMTTGHYGYATYYEGCLNSPVRGQIRTLVHEVLTRYDVDAMYFDGPYMGMSNARRYCHCPYCEAAYRKAKGKPVPRQDASTSREDEIEYTRWLANDVVIAFLAEIRAMIRKERDLPTLFNDTSLLSKREWRNRAIPVADGFMFEAAETPEEKLFNLQLGHSTGKVIWTYVGTHTQYNREHLKNERVRGWFSYPVESEELYLDGATALAGHAGLKYWGLSRFFYMKQPVESYPAGQAVRSTFDFAARYRDLLFQAESRPVAGLLVSTQTIDWYAGKVFAGGAYKNGMHGAFQLMKELSIDCEPFLDYLMTPAQLSRYRVLYAPHAPCLSDAQCAMIRDYVSAGGHLVATHLTSASDEFGRPRPGFGLADLFGAKLLQAEPVEIPDLYLRVRGQDDEIPQDPQVALISASDAASVLAETWDRGHRRSLGPAVVRRTFGKGTVVYIGSQLEAVYDETRMGVIREFLGGLLDPLVGDARAYRVPPVSGLTPHFTVSGDHLLLHLLADTGNKTKKLRVREEYMPLRDVVAQIRIPAGRMVKAARLLRAGTGASYNKKMGGWLEFRVPEIRIHEIVDVETGQ